MEDFEMGCLDTLDLEIDGEITASLSQASKWAKFISILIFCFCGLLLLILLIGSRSANFLNGFNSRLQQSGSLVKLNNIPLFIAVVIVAVIIVIVVYYFLFNFSRKVKLAIIAESTDQLNKGLGALKIYFIIYAAFGILGIGISAFSLFKLF